MALNSLIFVIYISYNLYHLGFCFPFYKDGSLLKSATEVVDILKLQNEKIVNLRSTIKSQGKKLRELKSKEIGLENMELVSADSSIPSLQE